MLRIAAEVGRALIATATVLMAGMTSRRSRPRDLAASAPQPARGHPPLYICPCMTPPSTRSVIPVTKLERSEQR